MFETFAKSFRTKDIRNKILFTLFIILVFRLGSAIPVPFIDAKFVQQAIQSTGGFLGFYDLMSGGGLSYATLFAMSIMPYINASIIIQLLTVAIPPLERLQKEGEQGRKKITKITRYLTVGLAIVQATGYYFLVRSQSGALKYTTGFESIFSAVVIIVTFTAGTAFLVWLGERISERGIGNGISIILFAGILSRAPNAIKSLYDMIILGTNGQWWYFIYVPLIIIAFLGILVLIVVMNEAERRIPVQYAKRVVGRKMYAGQNSHIPIKISMSGVMPIIFASAILSIPTMIRTFVRPAEGTFWYSFFNVFNHDSWGYAILYFILIIAFNFFYVTIQYNPTEIANNLRKSNGSIPGIRPGKPTSDFISKVIWKIAMVGALFLAFIAVFPIVFSMLTGSNIALGGTSVIIIVGVALETVRVLESQLTMQQHKGFLE